MVCSSPCSFCSLKTSLDGLWLIYYMLQWHLYCIYIICSPKHGHFDSSCFANLNFLANWVSGLHYGVTMASAFALYLTVILYGLLQFSYAISSINLLLVNYLLEFEPYHNQWCHNLV